MAELDNFLAAHGWVGIAALIVLKLGEMIWNYFRKRERLTDGNISALRLSYKELKIAIDSNTRAQLGQSEDIKKIKTDLRRCFFAVKKLSGDSWAEIAAEMKEMGIE